MSPKVHYIPHGVRRVWDPGGLLRDDSKSAHEATLLRILHDSVPRSKNKSVVVREVVLNYQDVNVTLDKVTFDSGASSALR